MKDLCKAAVPLGYLKKNIYQIIIIVISLFVIFPFVYITQYNIPGASDDILHGWLKADMSYFEGIWSWYSTGYNGRFANAFFMQIPGRIFLEPWFGKSFPLVLFACLYFSFFYLLKAYNGLKNRTNFFYATVLLAFLLSQTPDTHQFYWFSGSSVYILPAIFYFIFIALQIKGTKKPSSGLNTFLSILLLFFIIGSHENWMIIGFITSLLFFINPLLQKNRLPKGQIWIMVFTLVFAGFVLFAPGTTHRMAMEGTQVQNSDFWASISLAPLNISNFFSNWFLNWGSLISVFGIMILSSQKREYRNVLKSYSAEFWMYLSLIFILLGAFILLYSLGHFVELRIRGMVPTFISCLIALLIFVDLICENDKIRHNFSQFSKKNGYFVLSIGLIVLFTNSANLKNAYLDILTGNAKEAAIQSTWVQNYLKTTSEKIVYVPQLNRKTKTLYTFIIPEKPEGWYHWAATKYFNKEKIILNYNITLNDFIEMRSNNRGIMLYSKSKYCPINTYNINDLQKKENTRINVKASFFNCDPDSKAMLVFESDPLWQAYFIKDIIDENNKIDFNWDFPADSTFNKSILKVYFLNSFDDVVLIDSFESKIVE